MSPAQFVARARAAGLHRAAVTDHGCIDGAYEAAALDPDLIIIGEEIRAVCGTEVIGLFLRDCVPDGLTLNATVERIRAQNGIVYAPHPFAYLTRARSRALQICELADVIEVFNTRAFLPRWNRCALTLARERGLPAAASSDAHLPWELGRAYTELEPFMDSRSFRASLRRGLPVGIRRGNAGLHVLTVGLHAARRLAGRGHGIPLRGTTTPRSPRGG